MKKITLTALFITLSLKAFTQIAIGTNAPETSAALEVSSTTQGFLPPRMEKAQIKAIKNPEEGLMVYCLDCKPKGVYYNDGKAFVNLDNGEPSDMKETDVYSPATGRVWMDRNLGASRVALNSTDAAAYGDLYQWGRGNDGHSRRDAAVVSGRVSAGYEGSAFIKDENDWLSEKDDFRWNAGTEENPIKTVNDPCPIGYRVPTWKEWNEEKNNIDYIMLNSDATVFSASPLKLPFSGSRHYAWGTLYATGVNGYYWSSKVYDATRGRDFTFYGNRTTKNAHPRSDGFAVRCIKENQ